jgi:hypothetical protein
MAVTQPSADIARSPLPEIPNGDSDAISRPDLAGRLASAGKELQKAGNIHKHDCRARKLPYCIAGSNQPTPCFGPWADQNPMMEPTNLTTTYIFLYRPLECARNPPSALQFSLTKLCSVRNNASVCWCIRRHAGACICPQCPPHLHEGRCQAPQPSRQQREIRLHRLHSSKKRRKPERFCLTGCFTEWCIALQSGCTALHSRFNVLHGQGGNVAPTPRKRFVTAPCRRGRA